VGGEEKRGGPGDGERTGYGDNKRKVTKNGLTEVAVKQKGTGE